MFMSNGFFLSFAFDGVRHFLLAASLHFSGKAREFVA